jgi:hypothetical protein
MVVDSEMVGIIFSREEHPGPLYRQPILRTLHPAGTVSTACGLGKLGKARGFGGLGGYRLAVGR